MTEVRIVPATADRWDDTQHALTGGGDGRSCQCQWWTLTNAQFNATSADERRALLFDEVETGPPPGLLAYVDGEAAGWVRVGPRRAQPRLARTKAFSSVSDEPWDDPDVWAITCFVVRREHRGSQLMPQLLEAAVAFAREGGARVVEGYPIDPHAGRSFGSNQLFTGVLSAFAAAGFTEVGRDKPHRAVMSLALT